MLSKDFIRRTVLKTIRKHDFENVSDLSENDLADIISESLSEVLNSHDFMHYISTELAQSVHRHTRGGLR